MSTGVGFEASVSACMVLGTAQLGEFLVADRALDYLIQSLGSGVSSEKLDEGVPDECRLVVQSFEILI